MAYTTHNSREAKETFVHFIMGVHGFTKQGEYRETQQCIDEAVAWFNEYEATHHQELQKAREEERERIEAIFKEHVPPHAMDLEDGVWLKRLLNKAFGHENLY